MATAYLKIILPSKAIVTRPNLKVFINFGQSTFLARYQ
jgi:hypothetical protein